MSVLKKGLANVACECEEGGNLVKKEGIREYGVSPRKSHPLKWASYHILTAIEIMETVRGLTNLGGLDQGPI